MADGDGPSCAGGRRRIRALRIRSFGCSLWNIVRLGGLVGVSGVGLGFVGGGRWERGRGGGRGNRWGRTYRRRTFGLRGRFPSVVCGAWISVCVSGGGGDRVLREERGQLGHGERQRAERTLGAGLVRPL